MERPDYNRIRLFAENIRLKSLEAVAAAGSGHVGGVFSMAEALAVLYCDGCGAMRVDPENPRRPDRDKLVLSKGHCGPGLFAALALRGFFPMEELLTVNKNGTRLPSHCDMRKTPGVDMTTGSLGQGASTAAGLALADRIAKRGYDTFLVLGDGELDEGQVWEMALFAAQQRLDNLIALVDVNRQQLDGATDGICFLGDIAAKFSAFGWNAAAVDGHDVRAVREAIDRARGSSGAPSAICLETVKGKGWSRLEGQCPAHHSVVTPELFEECKAEIAGRMAGREYAARAVK